MRSLIANPPTTCPDALMIQLKGAIDTTTNKQLHHQLHTAIASVPHSRLLLDLNQVEHIDSAGLMTLVSALKLAKTFNKQLFLCSLSCSVRMILEITQLDRVFKVVEPPVTAELVLETVTHAQSLDRDLVTIG